MFSRLGAYDRDALDRMSARAPRRLFEYWAHAACLLPVQLHPLLRWRMDRARDEAWGGMRRVETEHPGVLDRVRAAVADAGPATAGEIELVAHGARAARSTDNWGWNWSSVKQGLEMLFWAGEVTSAGRRGFERLYDLPERALPRAVVEAPTPEPADARRELTRIAARALGVASEFALRDYFRLGATECRPAIDDLVESGDLIPVTVDGWSRPAYLDAAATVPRSMAARALLVPFDPLVFERARVRELFGMDYRIEIYTREPDRVYGYYVLPFLLGDTLVARVDLKADRQAGVLRVRAAHAEPGAPADTAEHLLAELAMLGGWLGLPEVVVEARGDLAPALAACAAAAGHTGRVSDQGALLRPSTPGRPGAAS